MVRIRSSIIYVKIRDWKELIVYSFICHTVHTSYIAFILREWLCIPRLVVRAL